MKGARALTPREIRRVLRELDTPRDRALFLLMLYTGARISEALAVNVPDVIRPTPDLAIRRQLVFQRDGTKGKRTSRAVPVHPELAGALVLHLGTKGGALFSHRTVGPLFLSRKGPARLTRSAAWRRLNLAFRAAGLEERVSPHSTRKTFAQMLHDRGNSLPVIQELMGHSDIADTIDYFRVPEEECDRAIWSLPTVDDGAPIEEDT